MGWIIFTTLAALLYNSSILTDEQLLKGPLSKLSTLAYTAIAGIAGLPILFLIGVIFRPVLSADAFLGGLAVGLFVLVGYQLYYLALRRSGSALATTMFGLIIPMSYLAGGIFFDERVTYAGIIGTIMVLAASTLMALDKNDDDISFDWQAFLYMLFAVFFLCAGSIVFKDKAEGTSYAAVAYSEYMVSVIYGLVLLIIPSVRKGLYNLLPDLRAVFGLTQINEVFSLGGTLSARYASVIGPLGVSTALIEAQQPTLLLIMVFIFSRLNSKDKHKNNKKHKIIVGLRLFAVTLSLIGILLIVK
jgi:hypothetical protein